MSWLIQPASSEKKQLSALHPTSRIVVAVAEPVVVVVVVVVVSNS